MKTITKGLAKGLTATVAAGAMAMASATPAAARDHRDNDGISAGEIIAGALIIGGIAAVVSSSRDRDRDYRYDDRRYRDRDYRYDDRRGYRHRGYRDNPRRAVEKCVRAAERTANRYSYGGRADVIDIRDVDRKRDGYRIKGRIAVQTGYRDGRYRDYRGYRNNDRGYDTGKFTCRIERGRVVDVDFKGIRGLR
ncbi:hypothetical protein [Paraurantiacibacter namhicola]|uniref:Uncharacterized protein n=1 Tax=Paraurantiacibacter namhicola TaxID=645517 RepID=A0A1C7D842_9SPHN|nr:hypothetical protein [Paraurantiacibacter namhicola]ANU07644.1 hypothetical protein A6F65_01338 [Paraurantiacibacter namhicola]